MNMIGLNWPPGILSLALAAGLLIPSAAIGPPVARAGEPTLCSYGSPVYSPFYALRITAPEHLLVAKGGHVVRCRVAFAVATLAKSVRLNRLNVRAEPGRFTLVVGGQKPSSSFPYSSYWRLTGRATCIYRVVQHAPHGALHARHHRRDVQRSTQRRQLRLSATSKQKSGSPGRASSLDRRAAAARLGSLTWQLPSARACSSR